MRFQASAIAAGDHLGLLHPGDISHQLFQQAIKRGRDLTSLVHIWEVDGAIAAWVMFWPGTSEDSDPTFDLQIHPETRVAMPELEAHAIEWSAAALAGDEAKTVATDANKGDEARESLLREGGWVAKEPFIVVNRRSLDVEPPAPVLPDGYSIRPAEGTHEAAEIAAVHRASFGSGWTAEQYAEAMQFPGYEAERELLCVAPDGSFAGFTVVWLDERNHTGLFEPVGTHEDHRRRGIATALLNAGMHLMLAEGMEVATVASEAGDPRSNAAYRQAGFEPWMETVTWTR